MRVCAVEAGHAQCEGRGERRRVSTALVGSVAEGDWLLVFLDDARERIDAARAEEVNATLDLVLGAMTGGDATAPAAFELPSALSADDLARLTGQT